jgi:putative ABC transport system permease protein
MSLLSDLRQAARALVRDRGYTTVALLTLAFGVAANTIIFSVVDAVLLRPLTYRDPGRLMVINEVVPEVARTYPRLPVNVRHFFEWRDHCSSFQQFSLVEAADFVLTRAGQPERLHGASVSANLLFMLGVQPQLGRTFLAEEEEPGHEREAIISDALWTRRFHRDPSLVGRSITLDGSQRTVVGILPASFHFPKARPASLRTSRERPMCLRQPHSSATRWVGSENSITWSSDASSRACRNNARWPKWT